VSCRAAPSDDGAYCPGTSQQLAHEAGQSPIDGCPQLAKVDMQAFGRHSGFDPRGYIGRTAIPHCSEP
jgi:hypothetical protein